VGEIAKRKGVTTAQVVIGWVVRQGAIPIPSSTKEHRTVQNCTPAELTDADMADLKNILDTIPVAGQRYGGKHEEMLNG
jgi:pyridoxine 4-dehydrogenase